MKRRDPLRDQIEAKPPKRSCVATRDFEGLHSDANEIKFKISKLGKLICTVNCEEDFFDQDQGYFTPKFTYQVILNANTQLFSDHEVIRGYENLSVMVYLTPCTLKPYVDVRYTRRAKCYDDIQAILLDHYSP